MVNGNVVVIGKQDNGYDILEMSAKFSNITVYIDTSYEEKHNSVFSVLISIKKRELCSSSYGASI